MTCLCSEDKFVVQGRDCRPHDWEPDSPFLRVGRGKGAKHCRGGCSPSEGCRAVPGSGGMNLRSAAGVLVLPAW